jgi:hypothetical protein
MSKSENSFIQERSLTEYKEHFFIAISSGDLVCDDKSASQIGRFNLASCCSVRRASILTSSKDCHSIGAPIFHGTGGQGAQVQNRTILDFLARCSSFKTTPHEKL